MANKICKMSELLKKNLILHKYSKNNIKKWAGWSAGHARRGGERAGRLVGRGRGRVGGMARQWPQTRLHRPDMRTVSPPPPRARPHWPYVHTVTRAWLHWFYLSRMQKQKELLSFLEKRTDKYNCCDVELKEKWFYSDIFTIMTQSFF
jgi:hypothetical protein